MMQLGCLPNRKDTLNSAVCNVLQVKDSDDSHIWPWSFGDPLMLHLVNHSFVKLPYTSMSHCDFCPLCQINIVLGLPSTSAFFKLRSTNTLYLWMLQVSCNVGFSMSGLSTFSRSSGDCTTYLSWNHRVKTEAAVVWQACIVLGRCTALKSAVPRVTYTDAAPFT